MAQIGQEEWGFNMVGTTQTKSTGAPAAAEVKETKKNSYKSILWQHNTKPLVYAAWLDNSIVSMLSKGQLLEILQSEFGVKQKKIDENRKRERSQSKVACPVQTKEYPTTFHVIDKGNGAEASFDMGGKSRTHNWTPKLVFWFYNMALNSAYKIYKDLLMVEDGNHICLNTSNTVKVLAPGLYQKGGNICTHALNHLAHPRNMMSVHGFVTGTRICSDANEHGRQ